MLFVSIMFLVALSIAGVAAFFSITGLVAIFSASAIAVIIMGTVLEVGKLVAISYTYRYWPLIGVIQKMVMMFFIVLLMVITSIGIFGFLSKAHLEKIGPQDQYVLQIDRLEKKIASENSKIERNQRVLDNLDSALDKYIELGFVTRGLEQREEQADQRGNVDESIRIAEEKIDEYSDEKSELSSKMQDIELEVGPIKYVAQLIYGNTDQGLEMAVKLLIIMLVCTFDPLAVALLIAANHAHLNRNDKRVRSEFSILEENNAPVVTKSENLGSDSIQNKELSYDDLNDDEKIEQRQKVEEYLKTLGSETEGDESALTRHKYRRIMTSDKSVGDNEQSKNNSSEEVSSEPTSVTTDSPYRLNIIDGVEDEKESAMPEKAKQKGNRFNWLPRRNPPKE